MSAGPDPRTNQQVIEQERRRLSQRLDDVARLCESGLAPPAFYGELLQRLLESLAAAAGSVWIRTPQGNLVQQFQINMQQLGLDASEEAQHSHNALLRMAFTTGQPIHLPPRSAMGESEEGKPAPGNHSTFMLLLVPIKEAENGPVVGLIEVFQGANRPANAVPGFLQYMTLMANLASRYQRNQLVGQLVGQQQLWTSLEAFSRAIHGSLNTTEVSFVIANEGRRLIECDRVAVAVRRNGQKTQIDAVSGADVVEKRSNQVRLMRKLADEVLTWGEKLVFTGTRDDALPPGVLSSLDAYLQESPSKLLVVLPLSDDREGDGKDKPKLPQRSALVMECFETPPEPSQNIARLEVVGRHASSALFNAIEYRRIPMRFLWLPLAKLQEGLGGKSRAIWMSALVALAVIITGLIVLPYPLKVEVTGKALPQVRRGAFVPTPGMIMQFDVQPNEQVGEGRSLAQMYDSDLWSQINKLAADMEAAKMEADELERQAEKEPSPAEKLVRRGKAALRRADQNAKDRELKELLRRSKSIPGKPGHFSLLAPFMTSDEKRTVDEPTWTVLAGRDFKSEMEGKEVQSFEQILQLGVKEGPWEIELKIPQKHIGQILRAYDRMKVDTLDVDFILLTETTTKYRGKLDRNRIAGEAVADKDENNESEPVVYAYVRIEPKPDAQGRPDIDPDYQVPRYKLVSSTDVKGKVRCGDYRAGYSLFYGVWEFLYEKVWFFLF
jgi:hypothetical protein